MAGQHGKMEDGEPMRHPKSVRGYGVRTGKQLWTFTSCRKRAIRRAPLGAKDPPNTQGNGRLGTYHGR